MHVPALCRSGRHILLNATHHAEENLRVDIDGFLTFADFFFDGFIADIFVQSKIREGQRQVQEAIRRVEDILCKLKSA